MKKIIAHLDMDAFFASVEQVRKPWLKGKPIGVTNHPNGRSVIATASYEARPYGIKSGMPVKTAIKLLPTLIIVKGDMAIYEKISDEIYEILKRYAPAVEKFSIDEAFLDLTFKAHTFEEAKQIATNIKAEIYAKFKLPSTIGISINKLLAKIASKEGKPNGLFVIKEEDIDNFMKDLPISKIPGIGKKIEEKIKNLYGVEKAGELQKVPIQELIKTFHSYGVFIYNAIRGIDNSEVIPEYEIEKEKSIGNSTTLDFDTDNLDIIKGVIRKLSSNVGYRLRTRNFLAKRITLTLRYEDFSTFLHGKDVSATNSDEEIYKVANVLFNEIYNGERVRLLGVTASKLEHPKIGLFEEGPQKDKKLINALDSVRKKFGDEITNYANNIYLDIKLSQRRISGR